MSDLSLLPETRRALVHRLATAQVEGRAPAMAAGVVRGGGSVWFEGRGDVGGAPPDQDVAFLIGSITKTFTAVLVMRLRDEGRLDLHDPISRHLPEAPPGGVTVAQLLSHTAGIAAEPPGAWWERTPGELRPDLVALFGDDHMKHGPGRRFHYSNPGFALLGALVERLRGTSWLEVLRSEILEPLGMSHTGAAVPDRRASGFAVHPWADVLLPEPFQRYGVMGPAGELWSTVADLCRWASFLAGSGSAGSAGSAGNAGSGERILAADTLEEMRRASAPPEPTDPSGGYGLGLQTYRQGERSLVGHGGSLPGFLAGLWVSRADDVGAVVVCNTTAGVPISGLTMDLVRIVAESEPRIPPVWTASSDPELVELAGPWYWGPQPLALRVHSNRDLELVALGGRARVSRLRPEPDGTWTGLDGYYAGERLAVVRDAAGAVTHLDLGTFVLTRAPYDPAGVVPGGVHPDGWRN